MKKFTNNLIKILILGIIVYSIIYLNQEKNDISPQYKNINPTNDILEIYYLDVGEADATYIHYKDYNILIDAGNTVDGKKLVNYLKELGVTKFDIVFATHAHEDHIGGMHWIVYKFPIDAFYMPNHPAKWKSYQNLTNALEEKGLDAKEPDIDQVITLEDLVIKVLWIGNDKEDYNENSIVIKLTYKNTSYLFMADAEESVEKQLLDKDIKSNVLKVGHHGSKYATTAQFLYKVHPEYAVISVGKENEYGHPHEVTLNKLDKINAKIYRTDIDHTIIIKSDGENININKVVTNINGGDL